ncbi:hypothetical protein RhiJN_22876 [Ceratobasidium sp. AG-Ba]|nr:hypothetical protein RhiJN_22876 [Ceratobasidium sp. AG-Ba]
MIRPRETPSCGFTRLPYELIPLIAQYLDDNDLASFAAILPRNPLYTRTVQRALLSHVTITTYARYANLTRTLQSVSTPERCMDLASMVQSITAILNTRPSRGEQRFIAKDLLNLYVQCPELRHITLLGAQDGRFPEHLPPGPEDLALVETLDNIHRLTITGPLGYLAPSLLLGLPALRELHILGGPTSFRLAQPPRSGSQIRHITWESETAPTLQVIKWICAYSTEVVSGDITLRTPPTSASELERIRQYAFSRNMSFSSPVPQHGSEVA